MAILQKTKPVVFVNEVGTDAELELQLVYEPAETPWTNAYIKFYTPKGTELDVVQTTVGSGGLIRFNQRTGLYNAEKLINDFPAEEGVNTFKYLVEVFKVEQDAIVTSTNKRAIAAVYAPTLTLTTIVDAEDNVTEPNVDFMNKTFTFEYRPTTGRGAKDMLAKYQIQIVSTGTSYGQELSDWMLNSSEGQVTISYVYNLTLEPEIDYTFLVNYETKLGYRGSAWVTAVKPLYNYAGKISLNAVRPQLRLNEEYGFVKIRLPKEVLVYNSSVSEDGLTIELQNCLGCGQLLKIYTSASLLQTVTGEVKTSGANRTIVADAPVTDTAVVAFAPKGVYDLLKEVGYDEYKKLATVDCDEYAMDNEFIYEDYEIEQGREYNYYFLPYGSAGATPTSIKPQWNSIILSDAEGRILPVQYNPQVSSFKTTIQEQKQDTLGGQFPFFLRNGDIYYKEIPLSGLISYHADPLNKFGVTGMPEADKLTRTDTKLNRTSLPTLLEQDEYYLERVYKREVEAWLNDGKPKLLRTAAEGNFIVRLMNVSLSPNQQLGRRLHTFSATAYEIAEYTDRNLQEYGLNCLNNQVAPAVATWNMRRLAAPVKETWPKVIGTTTAAMTVKHLPYGIGDKMYSLAINKSLEVPIEQAQFVNNSNREVLIVVRGVSIGPKITLAPGESITCSILNNYISCYIVGDSSEGVELKLLYETVEVEEDETVSTR